MMFFPLSKGGFQLLPMLLLFVSLHLMVTNNSENKKIFYVMQVSINSYLVNKVLIGWEALGINIAHIYVIIWSEYINHSLKKGKCIAKGRNIFSIAWHRSQCFWVWIHAIIEHQFFLVTFVLLNLQKTVWHWHIPPETLTNTVFFKYLKSLKGIKM